MKKYLNISFLFILLLSFIKSKTFIKTKNLRAMEEKYSKLAAIHLKSYMNMENIHIIDTRDNTISNKSYLKNSLLLPLTMGYATWLPSLVNKGSNIVLICDEDNYKNALQNTEILGIYNIIGYAIYNEIIKQSDLNIQKAEYNENTKKDVEKLVAKGKYLLDIREIKEYKETGVINEAHLIPLSTFTSNYNRIPESVDIYIFCKGGGRALLGMSYLKRMGFKNKFIIMRGGMTKTIQEGYPLVPYTE